MKLLWACFDAVSIYGTMSLKKRANNDMHIPPQDRK